MGTVLRFPDPLQSGRLRGSVVSAESATVIILPVVRVERIGDEPPCDTGPRATASSRRRRRASRS